MAWTTRRTWVAGEAICDGLARLADVAPTEIVVLSEESDWGLVGGDLREAIETAAPANEDSAAREELVEA